MVVEWDIVGSQWNSVKKQQVIDLLAALKEFFADPDRWVFFPRAIDKTGLEVSPHSVEATKWCLMGAGEKLALTLFGEPLCNYIESATRDLLDEVSDGKFALGMTYEDEYALLCLTHEHLTKGESE